MGAANAPTLASFTASTRPRARPTPTTHTPSPYSYPYSVPIPIPIPKTKTKTHTHTRTRTQPSNFPVLGNVRYIFESIRPEIRQYFIESDSEASPFDRQHRAIAYQRAKQSCDTVPFGTRRDVYAEGYEFAGHSMWPVHAEPENSRVLIGGPGCTKPYSASLLNISAMSYGALSDNAVLALSTAAAKGGFYHNTGEGGMSRFHLEGGGDLVWNVGTGYFGCGSGGAKRVFDPVQVRHHGA